MNWLKKNLVSTLKHPDRIALVERDGNCELSLSIQAELVGISRSSLYYQPRGVDEQELLVKRRLDELYTD